MSHGVNDSYAPSPPLPACLWFVLMCCGVAIAFRFRISFKFRFADSDSYGEIQFQHHVQIHMGSSLQRVITMSKVMLSLFALVCAFYCRTSDLDRCSRVCSCNMMLDVDAVRRLPWPLVLLVLLVEFTPQFDKARTLDFSEMFAGWGRHSVKRLQDAATPWSHTRCCFAPLDEYFRMCRICAVPGIVLEAACRWALAHGAGVLLMGVTMPPELWAQL